MPGDDDDDDDGSVDGDDALCFHLHRMVKEWENPIWNVNGMPCMVAPYFVFHIPLNFVCTCLDEVELRCLVSRARDSCLRKQTKSSFILLMFGSSNQLVEPLVINNINA